jgi:hypothetical protein
MVRPRTQRRPPRGAAPLRIDDLPDSIPKLIARIKELPYDPHVKPGTRGYNRYTTQKAHWLGWLGDTPGTGSYERVTPPNRGARYVYNRIAEPLMLLWLIDAAGVDRTVVREAQREALCPPTLGAKCKAIRTVAPWDVVAKALWRGGKDPAGRSTPA